jgi:nuclear pore complex protein Nup98-Nup96
VFEDDVQVEPPVPHPAGIVLHRSGYYTLPSLDELAKLYEETNRCEVSNFTIGRANYGNIYFNESMDVAGLNLDEIGKSCASLLCSVHRYHIIFFAVHIRHREVVVYPNDDAKPPLGQGLNRRAQVTLDRIYPTNKQTRAPIKDVDTIINMDYDTTLRKACYKMEARFIEYIPESGSWVFKVMIMRDIVRVGELSWSKFSSVRYFEIIMNLILQ